MHVSTISRDRSKFDDKSEKGIFLCFEKGMKGFGVYNPKSNKAHISRNVIFYYLRLDI